MTQEHQAVCPVCRTKHVVIEDSRFGSGFFCDCEGKNKWHPEDIFGVEDDGNNVGDHGTGR